MLCYQLLTEMIEHNPEKNKEGSFLFMLSSSGHFTLENCTFLFIINLCLANKINDFRAFIQNGVTVAK